MASPKKRRKEIKITRKQEQPRTRVFRHADGDRRCRGGQTYEQGAAEKRAMQQLGATPPLQDEEEE
jgi:hypothetical protein